MIEPQTEYIHIHDFFRNIFLIGDIRPPALFHLIGDIHTCRFGQDVTDPVLIELRPRVDYIENPARAGQAQLDQVEREDGDKGRKAQQAHQPLC